jgi:hypothetical protein
MVVGLVVLTLLELLVSYYCVQMNRGERLSESESLNLSRSRCRVA